MRYYTSLSDLELTDLLGKDDPSAFEEIFQRYAELLIRYAHRQIGIKEESEEFIQDIFISLWIRRKKVGHVTALRPYLFNMVKYKIIDHIRHSLVRRKFEEHFALFESVHDQLTDGTDQETDIQVLIEKSISDLPDRCQAAFRMRLNENLPYKEIADRMNISVKTVEKHISAALAHLRQSVGQPSLNSRMPT